MTAIFHPEAVGMIANDQMATVLVTKLCQPEKTFIDVGAHIGSIISSVIHYDRSINIIAIEAIPDKVKNLRKKYRDITIYDCAVGEAESVTTFYINTVESGYSSLRKPSLEDALKTVEIEVPVKQLDSLISDKNIDVIKIDVEGAEFEVLKGANTIILDNRPIIMFESAPGDYDNKKKIYKLFQEHKYEIVIPIRVAHNDSGLELNGYLEAHLYPRRTTNYFAILSERRNEIRDRARKILNLD